MIDWCLGIEQPENPFLPQGNKWIFGLYTVGSAMYRWVVVFSILLFLNAVLRSLTACKIIGQMIALDGLRRSGSATGVELAKFFYMPGRMDKVKKERIIATACVVVAVVAAIFFVPLPYSVRCSFEVKPPRCRRSMPTSRAKIVEVLRQARRQGGSEQPLLRLHNPDLELELLRLKGRFLAASKPNST